VRRPLLLAALVAGLLALPASASAAGFEPLSAKAARGFTLKKHGLGPVSYRHVNELQKTYPAASLGDVLGDVNRPTTGAGASGPLSRLGGRLSSGFGWVPGDNAVSYWVPQGITGQGNAEIVSWYSNDGRGVRFSFVNLAAGPRYRHVLAVRPTGGSGYARVPIHAGGIAWLGHYLYVVDTKHGLRVFDTDRMLRVKKAQSQQAGGYKYLLPQVGAYNSTGSHLIYSYVSADRHQLRPGQAGPVQPPTLIVGEYRKSKGARILTWPVNGATNLIASRPASGGWRAPVDRIQGATTLHGQVLGSSSRKGGYLYVGRPGKATRRYGWGRLPEDLYFRDATQELFSLTEGRGARTVFAVRASSIGL
jgi:hypothetical protein